jgi:hypothetical protein
LIREVGDLLLEKLVRKLEAALGDDSSAAFDDHLSAAVLDGLKVNGPRLASSTEI